MPPDLLSAGRIGAAHGVRGWVRVTPFTEQAEALLKLDDWYIELGQAWYQVQPEEGRRQGSALVVRFAAISDRDQAESLKGGRIHVPRAALPATGKDEYYWTDLIGLSVVNQDGVVFGKVSGLLETGANDVLVVAGERERLIPFLMHQVVCSVDLDAGQIEVDWHPDD